MKFSILVLSTAALIMGCSDPKNEQPENVEPAVSTSISVTDENFARAETDLYFRQQVERAPVNQFDHNRDSVNVQNQMIIRSNTDLLYSTAKVKRVRRSNVQAS